MARIREMIQESAKLVSSQDIMFLSAIGNGVSVGCLRR
jgi:hypothetical protein